MATPPSAPTAPAIPMSAPDMVRDQTAAERNDEREIAIWKDGVTL